MRRVRGISGDTSVDGNSNDKYAEGGQNFSVETDTKGNFTFGEKTYSISGDSSVEIKAMFLPEKSYASGFASLDGTVSGDFTCDKIYVNGSQKPIWIYGDDNIKLSAFSYFGRERRRDAWRVSEGGTYTTKTPYPKSKLVASLKAKADDVIIGLENDDAYIYNANNPLITRNTSNAEKILVIRN